ncbi:MAG: LON peptidase substrate-binding domain-containing protein [Burkholderiaceae bacterium]|nr:LON peptidase substrate-binding domain-containing protein [Burkholderiaceae bacterium]
MPLFPLQTVLFPGGLLQLKVFEARYLDLVSHCLRTGSPFGVVHLRQGRDVRGPDEDQVRIDTVGVLAHLQEVDAEQPGILRVRCQGGRRVALSALRQRADGLWLAHAAACADDAATAVPAELAASAQALGRAIESLRAQGQHPFLPPHRLDDAGWVANRWCEILPISGAAKQRLMALDEPVLRLKLVDEYLRGKGVV